MQFPNDQGSSIAGINSMSLLPSDTSTESSVGLDTDGNIEEVEEINTDEDEDRVEDIGVVEDNE